MGKNDTTAAVAEEVEPTPAKRDFVVFKDGQHFEERRLTVADWRKAGVQSESPYEVVWNAANLFRVPREKLGFLTEEEFQRFILADPRFVLVTE